MLSWTDVDIDVIYYILQFSEIEFNLEVIDAYFRDCDVMINAEQCIPGSYYDKEIGRVQYLRQIILQSNAMTKYLYNDEIQHFDYLKKYFTRERRRRAKKLLNGFVAIIFLKKYIIRFKKRYYAPPHGKGYLSTKQHFYNLI